MRIAVVSAGGVGGYFGALLAMGGNEVHFVAGHPHHQAMQTRGLQIRGALGDVLIQPALATDRLAEIGPVDLAHFCTKALDIEAAALQSLPLVGTHTTILSLQDGVESADQLGWTGRSSTSTMRALKSSIHAVGRRGRARLGIGGADRHHREQRQRARHLLSHCIQHPRPASSPGASSARVC